MENKKKIMYGINLIKVEFERTQQQKNSGKIEFPKNTNSAVGNSIVAGPECDEQT